MNQKTGYKVWGKLLPETNGALYKNCLGWRFAAGHSYVCREQCCQEQREACSSQQKSDNTNESKGNMGKNPPSLDGSRQDLT